MMTFAVLLVLNALCLTPGLSMVGYDCTLPHTNLTSFSLTNIDICSSSTDQVKEESLTIQLVSERNIHYVEFFSCLIERSSLITHCGMHSHASMVSRGFTVGEIIPVTRDACRSIIGTSSWISVGGVLITGIRTNTTSSYDIVDRGSLSGNRCEGQDVAIKGNYYKDVVVQSTYKITIRSGIMSVDTKSGQAILPSGSRAPLTEDATFDADIGYTFWGKDENANTCSTFGYSVLYEGSASIFTSTSGHRTLVVNTTDKTMAVGLGSSRLLCHQLAISTDHARVFVLLEPQTGTGFFFKHKKTEVENLDTFFYINSKLVFLEKHMSRELIRMYQYFASKTCEMSQQIIRQFLSLAILSPDDFAWAYTQRPGMMGLLRGEVIYLMQCPEVLVDYRPGERECTQELPIMYNGTQRYLKPRSRIIVQYASPVACSPIAPIKYQLGGEWMALSPDPRPAMSPDTIPTVDVKSWKYTEIYNFLASGIYSQDELASLQRKLLFPNERQAIQEVMHRAMLGETNLQGLNGINLIPGVALEKAQTKFMSRMYGWWWEISVNVAGVTGIIMIILMVKAFLNMIINGTLLYKTFGLSFKLLAAVWGTVAKHLLSMPAYQKVPTAPPKTLYPLEEIRVAPKKKPTGPEEFNQM